MKISAIVAMDSQNGIGVNNQLPWHLPNDLQFFKSVTIGKPIIMGRKTFESMGSKPLNGRLNIIITRDKNWKNEAVIVVHTMEEAIALATKFSYIELLVIGGGEIYTMALPLANKIWLTRVHTTIEGDTFFPTIGPDWERISVASNEADAKHAYAFDFECWTRK